MLSNFAVMAGLIGTITGMIKAFKSVGDDQGGNKATELAGAINEVTVQVVNLVVNHRSSMQPQA